MDRNINGILALAGIEDVATREGGVDRNIQLFEWQKAFVSRHPRGWRG